MKFCLSTPVLIVAFVVALMSQGGEALRGAKRNLEEKDPDFHFTPAHFNGCIQAQGKGLGSDAILGTDAPFCTRFSVDNDGLIRAAESNLCLQGSHGRLLQDGSKMRLYPCDRSNVFQKFAWTGTDGPLKLKSLRYDDLCVTFRGDSADIGVDPIIFKKCHSIPSTHTKWKATTISDTTLAL